MERLLPISLLLLCCLIPHHARGGEPFLIGVAPHTSARVILQMYQPLRLYLQNALNRNVEIVTAPDFTEFARRGLADAYDIAITTAHQARLLQQDAGYLPLLTYSADFKSVVLVGEKIPVKSPADLQRKKVLGLSPSSLVTLWGLHWLAENGVTDVEMGYVSASDSLGQLLVSGQAAAGFISLANYQKLPDAWKDTLSVFTKSPPMAGRVYVLNKRHASQKENLLGILWAFSATPEAKIYFEENKLQGYRDLEAGEMESMDKYASEVRQILQ